MSKLPILTDNDHKYVRHLALISIRIHSSSFDVEYCVGLHEEVYLGIIPRNVRGERMENQEFIERIIQQFHLEELPLEGGLFSQTYRSDDVLPAQTLDGRYNEEKPAGTAIIYLLLPGDFSALHRLPTDEIYHFYLGDPVELLQLYPDGSSQKVILGQDIFAGQKVQHVAPRGAWQGSHLTAGGRFALLGTTMAPGYTSRDYEGGLRDELVKIYPAQAALINQLTRPGTAIRKDSEE
jgi:uncharacterized protein